MMRKWISGEIFTFRFLNGVIQLIYDVIKFVYNFFSFQVSNSVIFLSGFGCQFKITQKFTY